MFKKTIKLLGLSLFLLNFQSIAVAENPSVDNTPPAVAENHPYTNKIEQIDVLKDLEEFSERITLEEMKLRLEQQNQKDELFVKVNEKDVFVLNNIIDNTSLQKQLLYLLPEGKIQHFYSNNKKTADSMSKILRHFQNEVIDVNGYRIVTDKDKVAKDTLKPIYHFWCIKLKYSRIINRTYSYGYPAIWGWGWDWDYWHHPIIIHRGGHGQPHGGSHHRK